MEMELPKLFQQIIGDSLNMKTMKERAFRVARSNSTVLISGETGTGKGLFARAIHQTSKRKSGPFVEVNCGAIPESLIESELFGYTKGAFTGALREGKKGRFLLADGGTIFLDEIGEMPLHLQVKLLHVLQNKQVEPIGADRSVPVDLRIIAASNQDLEAMIEARKFRKDLYFRLGVIPIHIPPLRERLEDILALSDYLLQRILKQMGRERMTMDAAVIDAFLDYSWPGNVRELENTIEYGINMCRGNRICMEDLPERILNGPGDRSEPSVLGSLMSHGTYQEQLKAWEAALLSFYMQKYGHDKKAVAAHLDISLATLYRKFADLE